MFAVEGSGLAEVRLAWFEFLRAAGLSWLLSM